MLSLLFTICMIWFVGKFFIFGLKASWGIMKLLCMVIFFPVILIGMVVGGLMYSALINTELFEKYLERFREPARELPKHTWNKLKEMTNTPKTGENS